MPEIQTIAPASQVPDFRKNLRQAEYLETVLENISNPKYKYFAYGGGIRGGKTYVTLAILTLLCKKFPKSKWVCVREDMPALIGTTVPSLAKLIGASKAWRWSKSSSNFYAEYIPTGARIYFKGESMASDPFLNNFLGFECNGFFLEQSEELSKEMWSMALQRSGSHYIDPMPPAFIFQTFNPTQSWPKELYYKPWSEGTLTAPYFYMNALPTDSPFITQDQWDAWAQMPEVMYDQFINGNWDAVELSNRWAYSLDKPEVITRIFQDNVPHDPRLPVLLSFDFNKVPLSCIAGQVIGNEINVFKEYSIDNSNIYTLCDMIAADYGQSYYLVTGDINGGKSSTNGLQKTFTTFYDEIATALHIPRKNFHLPNKNPYLASSRMQVASILEKKDAIVRIDNLCVDLRNDLLYCRATPDQNIDKTKNSRLSHKLDCFRYLLYAFARDLTPAFIYEKGNADDEL